jgi:integrase
LDCGDDLEDLNRFTVRKVPHGSDRCSYWIFTPSGELHLPSVEALKKYGPSSQQTYAYSLVDHHNWALLNGKTPSNVTIDDLQRYMKGITGDATGIYGIAWRRKGQGPVGPSAACNVAAIVKAYYIAVLRDGSNDKLIEELTTATVATPRWRSRQAQQANPLAPRKAPRRPRFLPDQMVQALFEQGVLTRARDLMIVTWLHDGGLRVGGLCGLRFRDLHLIRHHPCGQRADPHVHIVGRDDNPNGARAKSYGGAVSESKDGYVIDGVIRAVSPDMISTFYAYMLDEYHPVQHLVDHEQILIHGEGPSPGAALGTAGVRKMLRRACGRADFGAYITPHAFRHKAASDLYVASDFNAELVAQEFGWSDPGMVSDLYGKSANREAMKHLQKAWGAAARPNSESHLKPTDRGHIDDRN